MEKQGNESVNMNRLHYYKWKEIFEEELGKEIIENESESYDIKLVNIIRSLKDLPQDVSEIIQRRFLREVPDPIDIDDELSPSSCIRNPLNVTFPLSFPEDDSSSFKSSSGSLKE